MTDYTKLVDALRGKFIAYDVTGNHNSAQLYKDAADAIEALQAEQKKTVTQIFGEEQMAWEGRCKDLMKYISDLQAEIRESMQKCAECGDANMPKRGEWIRKDAEFYYRHECSKCGERPLYDRYANKVLSAYCPNCGAKMEVRE